MNALKCDRCGHYYDYDPSARYNYISFGHKDVVPSKHQQTKDLCPECMDKFVDWLENPFDPETCKRYLINENEEKWTDEDCECIGCWECKHFRQDKNVHNPYDEKDAYYCAHKKLYISGNMARPDYMDMRYTDFDKLGCKEEE